MAEPNIKSEDRETYKGSNSQSPEQSKDDRRLNKVVWWWEMWKKIENKNDRWIKCDWIAGLNFNVPDRDTIKEIKLFFMVTVLLYAWNCFIHHISVLSIF